MSFGSINTIGTASSTSIDYNPNVTYLSDGSYLIVYEAEAGLYDDLFIERYSADGSLLTSGQLLNSAPYAAAVDLRTPRITDLGNGQFVLNFDSGLAVDNTAFVFDYDFSTGIQQTLTSQNSLTPNALSEMQTLLLPNGDYMNVWWEQVDTGVSLEYRIFYETLSPAGVGSGPVEVIAYTTAASSFLTSWDPQIAYVGDDANGNPEYRIFYTGDNGSGDFIRSREINPVDGTVNPSETFNIFNGSATISKHQLLQIGTDEFYLFYELNGLVHVTTNQFAGSLGTNELPLSLYEGFATVGPDGNVYVIGQESTGVDQYDLVIKKVEFDGSTTTISTVQKLAEGTQTAQFQDFHADYDEASGDMTFAWRDADNGLQSFTVSYDAAPTGQPVLVGLRSFGETIRVDLSDVVDAYGIDMSTVTYTWFEDGLPTFNGFGDSYVGFNQGVDVSVLVSYENIYGDQEFLLSAETAPIEFGYTLTDFAVVEGRMAVGETLTVDTSELDETNLDYQLLWFVGGAVVGTSDSLELTAGMVGEEVDLYVSIDGSFVGGFSSSGGNSLDFIVDVADDALVELDGVIITGTSSADSETGTLGDDTMTLLGGDDIAFGEGGADFIRANAGNDTLYGGLGEDNMSGAAGNDDLFGGADNDYLIGGEGSDIIDGGEGYDTMRFFGTSGGVYVDLNAGEGLSGEAQGDTYLSIEKVVLTNSTDVFIGGAADERVIGGGNDPAGREDLFGGDGADWVSGDAGNDLVSGDAGNDRLQGGAGSDLLFGGLGNDRLEGGADVDLFYFGDENVIVGGTQDGMMVESTGRDVILDFDRTEDRMIFNDTSAAAFSDLTLSVVGNDTYIDYANGRVIVRDSAVGGVTELDSTDFLFL